MEVTVSAVAWVPTEPTGGLLGRGQSARYAVTYAVRAEVSAIADTGDPVRKGEAGPVRKLKKTAFAAHLTFRSGRTSAVYALTAKEISGAHGFYLVEGKVTIDTLQLDRPVAFGVAVTSGTGAGQVVVPAVQLYAS